MSKNSKDAIKFDSTPISSTTEFDAKNNWTSLNQNLSTALKTWDELCVASDSRLSPDEKQLQEIKNLLKDLQSRIEEFK